MESKFFGPSDSSSEYSDEEQAVPQKPVVNKSAFAISDDEDEPKRVVRSTKDKRFDEMHELIRVMKNHKKIKDMCNILSDFESFTKAFEKAKRVIDAEGIPRFYIRTLAELEDFVNECWEDRDGRKSMSKNNAKGLTNARQKIRKYNRDFEAEITAYRTNPDEEDDDAAERSQNKEESGSDNDDDEVETTAEIVKKGDSKAFLKAAAEDDDDDSSNWSSSEDDDEASEEDAVNTENIASRFLKKVGGDKETIVKKKRKERVKKDVDVDIDEAENEGDWEEVKGGAPMSRAKPKMFGKDVEINSDSVTKKLFEICASRGKKGTDRRIQIDLLCELHGIAQAHDVGDGVYVKIHIDTISAIFDVVSDVGTSMKPEYWDRVLEHISKLLQLLCERDDITLSLNVIEDDEKIESPPYRVHGCMLTLVERMDDEFTKILQNCDAHSTEYIDRLKDERMVCNIIEKMQQHCEERGVPSTELCRIYFRRLSHIYYKFNPLNLDEERNAENGAEVNNKVAGDKVEVESDKVEVEGNKVEVLGDKIEVVGDKDEVAGNKDEVAGNKDEVAGDKDKVVGDKDEVAGDKNEVAGDKDKVASDKNEVAGNNDEVAGDKNEVAGDKDEVVGDKDEVAGDNNEVVGDKNEVVGDKNEVAGDKDEVVGDKDEVVGDKNEVVGDKNEVVGDKNEVVGDKDEVAGDKNKVAGNKDEVVGDKAEVASGEKDVVSETKPVTNDEKDVKDEKKEVKESTNEKKDVAIDKKKVLNKKAASVDKALVDRLCMYIYARSDVDPLRTQAILYQIYHHSLHDHWYKSRDLMQMSHLQDSIGLADIPLQIRFNRSLVQLGLCAFRAGFIIDAHNLLADIQSIGKAKELLAQGLLIQKHNERTPEQEKKEKQRLLPYHMHINLELMECVYLVSAMLIEIPIMAANEYEPRRRMVSRNFYHVMRMSERQMLTGPPESMREHVVAASKAMKRGDWQACANFLINDKMNSKVWNLFYKADLVRDMVTCKVQEESLRTYLFTYSAIYDTLSLRQLGNMFELPKSVIHSVISKMIINEELMASLDEPTEMIIMHRTEPSHLQALALQFTDKVTNLVDHNEKISECRQGNYFKGGQQSNYQNQNQGRRQGRQYQQRGY